LKGRCCNPVNSELDGHQHHSPDQVVNTVYFYCSIGELVKFHLLNFRAIHIFGVTVRAGEFLSKGFGDQFNEI